jgi:hypothetical protein
VLESNRRRVQNLTGLEIWFFIISRVLVAFGLGVLAMAHFPSVASPLAFPIVIAGILILLVASRGLLRRPPSSKPNG